MNKKSLVVGALGATIVAAIAGNQTNLKNLTYEVERVVDGDTFVTKENQMIRLTGVDAPELENCDGPEAKKALEKIISGKKLYLKVIYKDSSDRLISHVYNDQGLVATQMAALGMAYYTQTGISDPGLKTAYLTAKQEKIGIFSSKCTQISNISNSKCPIKGNVHKPGNTKLYRFPGCGQYNNTDVQLFWGDKWFCTESEAQEAGFTKGSDCFNKSWHPGQ